VSSQRWPRSLLLPRISPQMNPSLNSIVLQTRSRLRLLAGSKSNTFIQRQLASPKDSARHYLLATGYVPSSHIESSRDRLEAKLCERAQKHGRIYRNAEDIRKDIVDLAGVRIAVYFPSDKEKIEKIIRDAFTDIDYRVLPQWSNFRSSGFSEDSSEFMQRFSGYSEDHYRV
jgi:hypothetical protein